jgi:ankyrin repeat protein
MRQNLNLAFNQQNPSEDSDLLDFIYSADYTKSEKQLVIAAAEGDTVKVADLIKEGINLLVDRETPLREAVKNGHLNVVKLLVAAGSLGLDVGTTHYVLLAYAKDYPEIISYLQNAWKENALKQEFDTRSQPFSPDEDKLLYEAVVKGDNKTLTATLKDKPRSINALVGPYRTQATLLQHAAASGHKDTVELLLNLGADVNWENDGWKYRGSSWETALVQSIKTGHIEITKLLLDKGAYIDGTPPANWFGAPLRDAFEYLRVDMVKLLLERGADITNALGQETLPELLAIHVKNHLKGSYHNMYDAAQVPKLAAGIATLVTQKLQEQAVNNKKLKINVRKNIP